MVQLKNRANQGLPHRLMFTICFYQDSRHEKTLFWIRDKLGIGYVFRRKDGMTELRVNGYLQTKTIMTILSPYLKFKKLQAEAMYQAAAILCKRKYLRKLTSQEKNELIRCILVVQNENYASRHKKSEDELKKILGMVPVTTSPARPERLAQAGKVVC